MKNAFESYITKHRLFKKTDRLLLAFSGGIDSVACLHLLKESGYSCSLAHCNFQLRGTESDGDEAFTQELGAENNIEVHTVKFDTHRIAEKNKWSIQMAARNLRYEWFEEIRVAGDYHYIILAHQADDSIETMLINLTRGTGITGLTGIQPTNGSIRRPMLFAHRQEIEHYVKKHQLTWREDSSNAKEDYMRNRIRHTIIPEFIRLNPAFRENSLKTIEFLKEDLAILEERVQKEKSTLIYQDKGQTRIILEELKHNQHAHWILYQLLTPYGFHSSQIDAIYDLMAVGVGKQFYSEKYQLTIDRNTLYIIPKTPPAKEQYVIRSGDQRLSKPMDLCIALYEAGSYTIQDSPNIGAFDYDKLSFPLTIEPWKDGDRFKPLGMDRFQKVSDFLINKKVPRHQKQALWLLRTGDQIAWIIGHRIDHRFRITRNTRKVLQISLSAEC